MDYLQYQKEVIMLFKELEGSFKPCYKWITFNTQNERNINELFKRKF